MNNLVHKILVSGKPHLKVLLVFAAFLVMVVSSCIIMHYTLRQKLLKHTETSINEIQYSVSKMLLGPEMALNFFADAIQGMILRGGSLKEIEAYLADCSTDDSKKKISTFNYHSLYGYFNIFDAFSDGKGWVPPDDYAPQHRPWYKMAIAGGGDVVVSPVYMDANLGIPVVFYSRSLLDHDGRILGVAAINVPVDFNNSFGLSDHISENSYNFVVNENFTIINHPNKTIIGKSLKTVNPEVMLLIKDTKQGLDITKQSVINYNGVKSIIFIRKINRGWYVIFVVPKGEYYKHLYYMIGLVSILGILMASALSFILVRLDMAKNRADLQNQQKSNFLAMMSHEIRTPMNAIMGIAEAQMLEQDETLPKNINEAFDRIYYSGSLLLQIISDLLDLSKAESGKLDIMTGKYEIASLINEVVHLNRIRFDSKPIKFKLLVDENIPRSLVGDELRLKQILNNLLSNAFKYTWRGEVQLSITAEIGEDALEAMLVFTVSDTGQGIDPQDLNNLFAEYTRYNLKANRSVSGTGLGLNITKKLVNLMQGEISVESELEKGSTFTVRLPQKLNGSYSALGKEIAENLQRLRSLSPEEEIPGIFPVSKIKKPAILREPMPYGSVLIVDDVEMNLFVAKLLMRPYELKIDTASSGYEAIGIIKGGNVYDIIFIDHMMPKMDGMETTKILRGLGYGHPIIALTANAVVGQTELFLSNGFDDFISKPIDIKILNVALKKYIRDKHTP